MLKTIGYAFSLHQESTQLSPTLFFNEPDLENLDWVATLFPEDNIQIKLTNFISHYHQEPLLIIGGDDSCLQSILKHPTPCNIITYGNFDLPKPTTDKSHNIVIIDAFSDLPKKIEPNTLLTAILNYDAKKDPTGTVFKNIKRLLITMATTAL